MVDRPVSREVEREASLLSPFLRAVHHSPHHRFLVFVGDQGKDVASLTYGELAQQADRVRRMLTEWGIHAGDRAILVYPPSLDFVVAFVGCLAAGVIPVPVPPPDPFKLKADVAAFTSVAESCGARLVLTNSEYDRARAVAAVGNLMSRGGVRWPRVPWRRSDKSKFATSLDIGAWHDPSSLDEVAFLQYTSGSTGAPKGVMLTHSNLLHEVRANREDLGLGPDVRAVSWVPHFHDLGLISVLLNSLAGHADSTYLMSPLTFLRRPATWFDVMARVRATHTAAPNFAYELAMRKTTDQQRHAWDLSSTRVMMSAAEPIRASTIGRFYETFACTGLTPDTFYPAYGLAESSVSVTMGGRRVLALEDVALGAGLARVAADGVPASHFYGCGRVTKPDARVRIVCPDNAKPMEPGQIGEVWVHSATNAIGYWGMPEESARVFAAQVSDEDDDRRYLRTGDLGFFHDDELFITGRLKDLIIIRGHNIYPNDLEDSIRGAHPLIRPGGVAAFGVPAADDRAEGDALALFVEVKDRRISPQEQEDVIAAVRRELHTNHQVRCDTVVLGTAGLVRKTTSGKVRRAACRQAYLEGRILPERTTVRVSELAGKAVSDSGAA